MQKIEEIGNNVIGCAIKVHRFLGPGLLESAYQKCLTYELNQLGYKVKCEVSLPIRYNGLCILTGYRIDMLVEKSIIIENKTVDNLLSIHDAQLLTYLKLSKLKLGYIINWKTELLKQGIKRMVNQL